VLTPKNLRVRDDLRVRPWLADSFRRHHESNKPLVGAGLCACPFYVSYLRKSRAGVEAFPYRGYEDAGLIGGHPSLLFVTLTIGHATTYWIERICLEGFGPEYLQDKWMKIQCLDVNIAQ
jgi:hypothetical protein